MKQAAMRDESEGHAHLSSQREGGSGGGAGLAQDRVGEAERLVGEPHDPAGGAGRRVVDEVAHHGEGDVGDRVGADRQTAGPS